jgi:hypothetical protein
MVTGHRRRDRRSVLKALAATAAATATGLSATDLSATLSASQPETSDLRRRHGAVPWQADDFVGRIGVNVHLAQKGTVYDRYFESSILPAIEDLAVMQIRQGVYSPAPGITDVLYERMRELTRMGRRFSVVCNDPSDPYVTTPPSALPRIHDLCGGAIDIVEGGNEPALLADPVRNPTLSWLHQRALHETVRRDLPGSRIAVASPSYIQGNIALARPLTGFAERSNLHPYPGMEHPETRGPGRLGGFREAMVPVCGPVESIITETGYHTALATASAHLPVSEPIRARYMPRLLLFAYLAGMRRTYLYELRSSFGRGDADPESAFGLLTHDGRQTATYRAVKRLIALFSGPRAGGRSPPITGAAPVRITTVGDHQDVQGAAFRRGDGAVLLPLWLGVPGWDPATRTARVPVERRLRLEDGVGRNAVVAHRFDDEGDVRAEPVALDGGTGEIRVSDRLTVLEFAA